MSADCGVPGFGQEAVENEKFMLGRMTDMNRTDMPMVAAAIPARTLVKIGTDGKTCEPVTASTDTPFGFLSCDKDAGVTRFNVFTQGDVNRDLVLPLGLDLDQLTGRNNRITFKKLIMSGLE